MTMTPRLRRFALTVHVTSSIGWLGAVAAFLALAVAGLTSQDAQMARGAYLAMDLTTRFVIILLALAALLTGMSSHSAPRGLVPKLETAKKRREDLMSHHRHLILLLALVMCATAIAVYLSGSKWLWLDAGTAATVIGIHVALVALAVALGGASLLGSAATRLHRGVMKIDTTRESGNVIHWAGGYDLLVWALLLGRERTFREKTLDLAGLAEGESVLDVGCGTGTLAIAAKYRVGDLGRVRGVDPSPEMIGRAKKKARKKGVEVDFQTAAAESLPFQDATFDVVLSTVMLHHLPGGARATSISEIRRMLKPGGRFLAVDFGGSAEHRRSLAGRLHAHAKFELRQVVPLVHQAGLAQVESGPMGFHDMEFIRAAVPR
jgi:ubiquinone/menaquinone biosynthesis C-methylase UbiE